MSNSCFVMRSVNSHPIGPVRMFLTDEADSWSVRGEGWCKGWVWPGGGLRTTGPGRQLDAAHPSFSFSPEAREVGVMATGPSHRHRQGATVVKTSPPEGSAHPRTFQKPRLVAPRAHLAPVHTSLSRCCQNAGIQRSCGHTNTVLLFDQANLRR